MRVCVCVRVPTCGRDESVVVTGCDRMLERPIEPLVTALQALGGRLEYVDKPGRLPLRVYGGGLRGGTVVIRAVESRYAREDVVERERWWWCETVCACVTARGTGDAPSQPGAAALLAVFCTPPTPPHPYPILCPPPPALTHMPAHPPRCILHNGPFLAPGQPICVQFVDGCTAGGRPCHRDPR